MPNRAEILKTVESDRVRFLRLQFTDILGVLKNVEVPRSQFEKALDGQIMFDGSSIEGFVRIEESDMLLVPDLETFRVNPWPSPDGSRCLPGTDWSRGWLMFENKDRDSPPRVDIDEPILRRHTVHDSVRINANRRGFTLRATFLRATNGTIVVCDRAGRIRPKGLVVSYTGRPRVAIATPAGKPYSCAG